MGSFIELNYVLQITTKQGFPKELVLEKHLKKPFTAKDFEGQTFSFRDKDKVRLYQLPPVHVFLAHNTDGKWLMWGQAEVTEEHHDMVNQVTSGKFRIIKIYAPDEMKQAEEIVLSEEFKKLGYFSTL